MRAAGAGVTVIKDDGILIEKDVPIPLSDGHVVYCNVFRPDRDGAVPAIVVFTPYGKDSDVAVDFKRYWDVVLRDHPEVVRDGSTGKYLTWEVPDAKEGPHVAKIEILKNALTGADNKALEETLAWLKKMPTMSRSARRQTVRATGSWAAPGDPPGSWKWARGPTTSLSSSIRCSRSAWAP